MSPIGLLLRFDIEVFCPARKIDTFNLAARLIAWKMIFSWAKGFWNSYLSNWLKFIWEKIVSILGKEVEQRRPGIEQEFKKETEEMKQDIPKTTKSLWQRLKDLLY